jgi:predicted DNA-binding ribbon-helix-helix protein
MANPHPHSRIDLEEIAARNDTARHMIAGFSAEMPLLADFWRHLDTALADNLTLSAEVTRLNAELTTTQLNTTNLLAAVRATLAAYADGEADPCTTSETNSTPARCPPATGGNHDQLPADAPPRPPGATRGHAAHDGHKLR